MRQLLLLLKDATPTAHAMILFDIPDTKIDPKIISRKLYRSLVFIGNSAMEQNLKNTVSNCQVIGCALQKPDAHLHGSAVAQFW